MKAKPLKNRVQIKPIFYTFFTEKVGIDAIDQSARKAVQSGASKTVEKVGRLLRLILLF